ncbi:DUF3016 domain-containing protein [Pseudoroseomonas sp. WGS1072]|uniref:DUF3016 domain-containing protein n=1 Tax=Roseomonas sp. WGS1072 TaxID=3366816 RepID=UPI003BF01F9C
MAVHLLRRMAPLAAAGLLLASPALAGVSVDFADPARFTDARLDGGGGARPDAPELLALRRHLEALGARLPPGTALRITVLDIDLAGRCEPWRIENPDLRVMTPATWPRIRLRYALDRPGDHPGEAPAMAEESVSDMAYLTRARMARAGDRLWYEKAMLDDWFRQRFLR